MKKNTLLLIVTLGLMSCATHAPRFATPLPRNELLRSPQQQLAFQVDTLLNNAPTQMGWWGVKIQYANTGELVYERNAQKMFMPASNMKMYTTAAALCLLGPQYRYETGFLHDGEIDGKGVLKGNLIVKGSGDPTWSWRFYEGNHDSVLTRFVDSIQTRGITHIQGDLIGDDNIFDDVPLGYGWSWDDENYYYAAQLSGLSYNENYIDYKISPDSLNLGASAIIAGYPETDYLNLRNDLITVASDTATDWDYGRERGSNNAWFEGQYRREKGESEAAITVENPTLFMVSLLKERLEAAGISVSGNPRDIDEMDLPLDYDSMVKLFCYQSHTMLEIATQVNRPSQNFIAETLQKTLGAEFGEEGSSYEGRKVEYALFDSLGMDITNLKLRDGSGLSRHNLVSPYTTSTLLQIMWDHPYRSYFMESLPLSATNGTIKRRMLNSSASANVRAKTGYVGYVRSLSGYVWTRSGEPLIVSLMVNHYTIPTGEVNKIQDQIMAMISDME